MSIQKAVFDRFTALYGLPKSDDLQGFFSEYVNALQSVDKRLLQAGIDLIVKRHRYPTWPTIGEIAAAVREAAANADRQYRYATPALSAPHTTVPSEDERARVADLMTGFRQHMQDKARMAEGDRQPFPAVDAESWANREWRASAHWTPYKLRKNPE